MTFIECGACGALIHVPAGQTPEAASIDHRENADHAWPGTNG